MNLKKLQQDRADAKAAADALMATARTENRIFTEAEGLAYDGHIANIKSLDTNIERARAALDIERSAPAITIEGASAGASELVKKGFTNLGEQMIAVMQYGRSNGHIRDERLFASATGQNETIDAEGGFLVQAEFAPDLLQRTFAAGIVTSRCKTRPMSNPRLVLNGVDDSNRVGGPAGAGIVVYRAAEAGTINLSKLKFRRVELNVNKLVGAYKATDEILADAPALQAEVNDYFPPAFSWRMDNEVLNGTGADQFLGILTSGATAVCPKTAGQTGGLITTQNILNMLTFLWVYSRSNAVWLVGPDVESVLMTLTIPGSAGTAVAIYTPPGMYGNNSKYGLLMGMPVIPIEQTAPLGTQGDIILGDFSQYVIGERDGLQFSSSIHVAFFSDEQVFKWTLRNDGKPLWDKPVTQNNSANKVSPFVVLQSRP